MNDTQKAQIDSEARNMNEERYILTMTIAKKLFKQGIISDRDYCQIDTKFKDRYAASFSTLFTDMNLINFGERGNM